MPAEPILRQQQQLEKAKVSRISFKLNTWQARSQAGGFSRTTIFET
jgi:hypothetical protein